MSEFDRTKTVTDYLAALTDLEINDMTELDAAPRLGWEAVVRSVRDRVVIDYGNGNIDPQDLWEAAWKIADGEVQGDADDQVAQFAIVGAARRVDKRCDVDFSGVTGVMDAVRRVLDEVYGTAAHRLMSAAEQHADAMEAEFDESEQPELVA